MMIDGEWFVMVGGGSNVTASWYMKDSMSDHRSSVLLIYGRARTESGMGGSMDGRSGMPLLQCSRTGV